MNTKYQLLNHQFEQWIATRKKIHQHPELAFNEFQTSALVAKQLQLFGLHVEQKIGQTGVIGVLRGNKTNSKFFLISTLPQRAL